MAQRDSVSNAPLGPRGDIATQTLAWVTQAGVDLLSIALDHLMRMGYHRRDTEVVELAGA